MVAGDVETQSLDSPDFSNAPRCHGLMRML